MAGKIEGITIKIGADTSALSRALNNLQRPINKAQKELRSVEQLLKMNPGNTVLVRQKFTLLSQSIEQTENKLKEMKAALKSAGEKGYNEKNSEGYRKLQQEIIKAESKLKELTAEQARFAVQSSKLGIASQKLSRLGDKAEAAANKLRGISMAIGVIGGVAVTTTAEFDSSMSKVQAIDKAREMGAKTKFSASEAAEAMNYMAMAGWKTTDMLSGVEGIMNLAAASGEDLATTSDIVTDALTAFGLTAADSGHFADILAAASSNANTNVSMMGETFKYCAPVAGALGFSAENTAQAIGLMANAGIKSSQAGTALRTIMNNLSKDFTISGKNIGDVTIKTQEADGSMRSLNDILKDSREAFSGLTESEKAQTAQSLVGKNAMSGFLALMNASPKDISKLQGAIEKCDGASESMAETMQDNLGGQVTKLKSATQELAISVGDTLVPMMKKLVSKVQDTVDWFNGLSDGAKTAVVKSALLTASLAPMLLAFSKTTKAINGSVNAVAEIHAKIKTGEGVIGKAAKRYSALKKSIEGIKSANAAAAATQSLSNANKAATATTAGFTTAQKALNVAMKAAPYVAVAAGIAALAAVGVKVYQNLNRETIAAKKNAEARQKSVDAINAEATESEFYLQRLDELSQVEDKSSSQKQLMQSYVDKLNESTEGLNLTYDAEKDKLNESTEAIRNKIEAQKEEALQAAYAKNSKKALEEYVDAQMKATDAQNELNQKKDEWNNLSDSEKQVNGQLLKDIKTLKGRVEDYNGAMSTALIDATKWNNQASIQSGAWDKITDSAAKAGIEIPKSVTEGINNGKYVIPTTVEDLQNLIKFDSAANRATGDGKKIADNLAQQMREGKVTAAQAAQELVDATTDTTAQAGKKQKANGKQAGKEYAGGTSSQKDAVKSAAQSLVNSVKAGAGAGDLKTEGSKKGDSFATGAKSKSGDAKSAGAELKTAAKKGASGGSLKTIGYNLGSGLATGIRNALPLIESAANEMIRIADEAARASAKVNSPSKLFRDGTGIAIPEGLAAGINKGKNIVSKAAQNMIDIADTSSRKAPSYNVMTDLGINASNYNTFANDIVNGINTAINANQPGAGDIHLNVCLYPNGPSMGEHIVKAYDTYKRRVG